MTSGRFSLCSSASVLRPQLKTKEAGRDFRAFSSELRARVFGDLRFYFFKGVSGFMGFGGKVCKGVSGFIGFGGKVYKGVSGFIGFGGKVYKGVSGFIGFGGFGVLGFGSGAEVRVPV